MKDFSLSSFCRRFLCAFLLFLPFVEVYRSFFGDTLSVFGFAIEEILLLLWVGILFACSVLVAFKEGKTKLLIFGFALCFILFVYLLLHGKNASVFNPSLLTENDPDFLSEVYYAIRTYIAPTLLLLSGLLIALPKKMLFSTLRGVLWTVTLLIVIPTLLGVSFASYEEGTIPVQGGYLSWFSFGKDTDFSAFCAKGFFLRANVVGGVLFGLTPFSVISAFEKGRVKDYVLLVLTGMASVTVGTKIASFGFFLSVSALIILLVLEKLIRSKPFPTRRFGLFLPLVLFCLLLLFFSPGLKWQLLREEQKGAAAKPLDDFAALTELKEKSENAPLSRDDVILLSQLVEENRWDHDIDAWFPELYPVENDPEFWLSVMLRPSTENRDARQFKLMLCQRIREMNQNPADVLWGMGFTSGIPYAERDLVFQYYEFGAVGVLLLLSPFFTAFLIGVYSFLKGLIQKRALLPLGAACLSLASFFITSYVAGHVFDTVFPTYLVAAVSILTSSLGVQNET